MPRLIGFARTLVYRPARKAGDILYPPLMLRADRVVVAEAGHLEHMRAEVSRHGGNPHDVCDLTAKPTIEPWNPTLTMHQHSLLRIIPCPYHEGDRLTRCPLCNDTKRLAL